MFNLQAWLPEHWGRLRSGEKIEVNLSWLTPERLGFHRIQYAMRVGQVADWAMPLADGSRLHLWGMADGRYIVHRDRFDPARDPARFALHALVETPVGSWLAGILLIVGGAKVVSSLS